MLQQRTYVVARIPGFVADVEQRLLQLQGQPVAVVTGEGSRALVVSVSQEALQQDVTPGMRVDRVDARECVIVPLSRERCEDTTREVLSCLSLPLPDPWELRLGVFISCWTGGTRMLEAARHEAASLLHRMGFEAGWGIGPEPAVAEIAARAAGRGKALRVEPSQVSGFLTPLPIHALPDLKQQQVEALHEIGIHTLGQLAALPDVVLREMFGPEGVHLRPLALQGKRPDVVREWRGFRRLQEDSDDPALIRATLSSLLAEGIDTLTLAHSVPRGIFLLIVYSDGRKRGMRRALQADWHEGRIQRVAWETLEQLWTRRVRLSELRVTLFRSTPPPQQYSLFRSSALVGRDEVLRSTMQGMRARWGEKAVSFATACTVPAQS